MIETGGRTRVYGHEIVTRSGKRVHTLREIHPDKSKPSLTGKDFDTVADSADYVVEALRSEVVAFRAKGAEGTDLPSRLNIGIDLTPEEQDKPFGLFDRGSDIAKDIEEQVERKGLTIIV